MVTKLAKTHCKEAVENIASGFVWSETKEGHDYWAKVHQKLLEMSE